MWDRLRRLFRGRSKFSRIPDERIVGGMATMPSREATMRRAVASIISQVDRLYLYLDGYQEVPAHLSGNEKITPILSRDVPGLHANGKFFGLSQETGPCIFVSVDDDFEYAPDFAGHLRNGLTRYDDHAVVGFHGTIFRQPVDSFRASRIGIPYNSRPREDRPVHALGTGAVMFDSRYLQFDVRGWRHTNMVDLCLAIEATKASLQLISLARRKRYLLPLAEQQADSIHAALLVDDSRQTQLARELLRLQEIHIRR